MKKLVVALLTVLTLVGVGMPASAHTEGNQVVVVEARKPTTFAYFRAEATTTCSDGSAYGIGCRSGNRTIRLYWERSTRACSSCPWSTPVRMVSDQVFACSRTTDGQHCKDRNTVAVYQAEPCKSRDSIRYRTMAKVGTTTPGGAWLWSAYDPSLWALGTECDNNI